MKKSAWCEWTLPPSPASMCSRSSAVPPRAPAAAAPPRTCGASASHPELKHPNHGAGKTPSTTSQRKTVTKTQPWIFLWESVLFLGRATSLLHVDAAELSEYTHKYKFPQMFPSGYNVPGLFQLFPFGLAGFEAPEPPNVKCEPGAGLSPGSAGVSPAAKGPERCSCSSNQVYVPEMSSCC